MLAFISVIVLLQATSKRIRRDNPSNSVLNSCALHIAADHLFFKHVGSGSESVTVAEMVYHVAMSDKAFRATDFNQDGGPGDDIGFVIAAVTVFKDPESEGSQIFVAQKILSQFFYRPVRLAILQRKDFFSTSWGRNSLALDH